MNCMYDNHELSFKIKFEVGEELEKSIIFET